LRIAYQITYVWSEAIPGGGNTFRDAQIDPAGQLFHMATRNNELAFMNIRSGSSSPARPQGVASYADFHALQSSRPYQLTARYPKQHIQSMESSILPFGRGKEIPGNSKSLHGMSWWRVADSRRWKHCSLKKKRGISAYVIELWTDQSA